MRPVWSRAAVAAAALLVTVTPVPVKAEVYTPANPTSRPTAVSGDFNADGRADVALLGASGWNGVSVALRHSTGFTVSNATAPAFAAWASLPGVKVITGDFDSHPADDIMLAGVPAWSSLPLARSDGNGGFTVTGAATGMFAGWAGQSGVDVVPGDFNADGRTDVALLGGDSWSTIPVAFSNGDGTFSVTNAAAPNIAAKARHHQARMFSGDFDADGRADVAVLPGGDALLGDLDLEVAFSNGDGTFRETALYLPDFVGRADRKQVIAGDYNGDRRTDLMVVLADMILVAASRGNGGFDLYRAGASAGFYHRATRPGARIVGADYDCDGRTDLTVVSEPGNGWTTMPVAMPRGEEEFFVMDDPMPSFPWLTGVAGAQVVVGDYDADGCQDLAVTGGSGWSTVPIAMSNGDGSFHEQQPSSPSFAGWAAGASPVTLPTPPTADLGFLSVLDTGVISGIESSMAIGSDGLGIISYYVGGNNQNLRVAHCADIACSAITTTDLDTVGDVGKFSSIEIGRDGLPLITYISYRSATHTFTEDLKVAHCNDVACTSATITTLDSASRVNDVSPVAIGGDGLGLIAYQDTTSSSATRIKVAHCQNVACTAATTTTIATVSPDNGENGGYSQVGLATGNHGFGLISYYDGGANQMLKAAACTNADCSAWLTTVVDRSPTPSTRLHGGWSSVAFGHDGLALIAYNGNYGGTTGSDLKIAHCHNVYCTASTTITADSGGHVGWRPSVAIGGDGLGVVSYYDITNRDLKVAHCTNLACGTATAATVDSFDDVGARSSIAVGPDGLPLISYMGPGMTSVALRVVRCGNSDCTAPIIAPF